MQKIICRRAFSNNYDKQYAENSFKLFRKSKRDALEEMSKFNSHVNRSFPASATRTDVSVNEVRVRYAPSPTGAMHIGGLRTALYNYLYAKQNGGKFILRIEDTDKNREVDGSVDDIVEALSWSGLKFDEGPGAVETHGPYFQSQRLATYHKFADTLVEVSIFWN